MLFAALLECVLVKKDVKKASKLLGKDIKNSVNHIFGDHENCSSDFCKAKSDSASQTNGEQDIRIDIGDENDNDILGDQINFWNEGASVEDQIETRTDSNSSCSIQKL